MKINRIQKFFRCQPHHNGDYFHHVYGWLIENFNPQHVHMLMKRLQGMTWKEIGEEYGVSLQYAHRSVDNIRNELRNKNEQRS